MARELLSHDFLNQELYKIHWRLTLLGVQKVEHTLEEHRLIVEYRWPFATCTVFFTIEYDRKRTRLWFDLSHGITEQVEDIHRMVQSVISLYPAED